MATSTERSRTVKSDLGVGQKLAVGFGLVGLIAAALVLATFVSISKLGMANDVEERALDRAGAAAGVQYRASQMATEQLAYVTSMGRTRGSFEAASRNFELALDELRKAAASPAETALVAKIATGYQTFLAIDQFVWGALLSGETDAAHNLVLGPAALNFGFMAADADLFAEAALTEQRKTRVAFADTRDQTRVVVAALGVLALAMVASASRYITRIICDPLLELQQAAVQAADGDLGAEAPVRGTDETGTLATAFNSMLEQLRIRESSLIEEHDRGELARQIDAALELAETEEDAFEFVTRALAEIAPERSTELLLADNSRAGFNQVVTAGPAPEGPGCQVTSPYSCPAVRAAAVTNFDNSEDLDSCPHLHGRETGACSATCVPVSFMGRSVGVLHSTGVNGQRIETDVAFGLETLARAAGGRLGVIRTTARTQRHATTDGLTGLFNRRTFEAKVRTMHAAGESFTLVMADLDRFKLLNDTHGHEAGDNALKLFSQVLQESVREQDIVCRWGGEEFTIAYVGASVEESAQSLDRLRVELHGRIATSGTAPFTASFGYVDSGACPTFESAIRLADGALYEAKADGRDKAIAAKAPGIASAEASGAEAGYAVEEYDVDV